MGSGTRKLAVLGKPIDHSKSPAMHRAAYDRLGLPWSYERFELSGDEVVGFVEGLGPEWRGLSVTMPLKRDILPLLDERDEMVRLTGVANTIVFNDDGTRSGYNTDIHGIIQALADAGVASVEHALVLGGGATAVSAIVAAARLGANRVTVSVRSPQKSIEVIELGTLLGTEVLLEQLGEPIDGLPDVVFSTLPNGVETSLELPEKLRRASVLFDVAYEPWPTAFASAWLSVGSRVVPGIDMLVHQAVMQVRLFSGRNADEALPDEHTVIAAMRSSIGLG